ncbi:stability determinant [Blastomonas sp.]|uniref:type II toxin-antitoxin system RelB family antitoxin n=1 Tax=Blastomonas sp. TaxID=1909299 RepID=UPI0035935FB2
MVKYSPIESEFASSEEEAAHDAWVRAKVAKALASTEPCIPHEEVMARAAAIIEKAKQRAADLDR